MNNKYERYNYDFLVRVRGKKMCPNEYFLWNDRKNFMGITLLKKGFYWFNHSKPLSKKCLEEEYDLVVDNKLAYNKATITLYFVDGSDVTFTYHTDEEMEVELTKFKLKITNGIDI